MRKVSAICFVVVLLGCARVPDQGLEKLLTSRPMRASSSDPNWQNGNWDARPIAPGETITLGDLEGPGIIKHIWFTIAAADALYARNTVFRIHWDGEEDPSVEAPMGDFFAVGHGMLKPLHTFPINISSGGRAYNCYWRMPFRKTARLTMTNDSDKPVHALYWYIDWAKEQKLPKDSAYFHARYRQEYPCTPGQNYVLLEAEGRGHYVGTVQSVIMAEPGWYGEGDDFFFIDGEQEPSLRGTGTEDYFCDAWGFRPVQGLFYGIPIWEGMDRGDRGTAYRWHIPDPISFTKSLRVEIEHKGSRNDGQGHQYTGFEERPDCFSTVAYWYQIEPHKPFGHVPPVAQRTLPQIILEAEAQIESATFSPDTKSIQDHPACSGGKQIFFTPSVRDASFEVTFDVAETLTGVVELLLLHSWDYGIYNVSLNGSLILKEANLYAPSSEIESHKTPLAELSSGKQTLLFECVGSDPRSKLGHNPGYYCGF
ncbi:MAG TPA: DUF2961 domain-containing protein, partial [bacterium]|nr:DUF2961 domain-containing protein [bacterium]